jgi:hypothetical protein
MQGLGWTEERNVRFDTRFTGGSPDKARTYAAELAN